MNIVCFGRSGRLARICAMAIRLAQPQATLFVSDRSGGFVKSGDADSDQGTYTAQDLLQALTGQPVVLVDASVDHSSTSGLQAHEAYKRSMVRQMADAGLLAKAVGFSSGITLVDSARIDAAAAHMSVYRTEKLAQEALFADLPCPVFLPNLFTLVGPITYSTQGAAWAQVLRARVQGCAPINLAEPDARKAWTSEFRVFQQLLDFLAAPLPASTCGALVDGSFTLAEIAGAPYTALPPLAFSRGGKPGWLEGDYLPPGHHTDLKPVHEELLRSLCH